MGLLADSIDTYCVDALVSTQLASGLQVYAQRQYHRLTTPSGTLLGGEEEADFGIDLSEYVGKLEAGVVDSALPVRAQNELAKDPETVSVSVTPTRTVSAGQVTWNLAIALVSTQGNVQIEIAVSSVTTQLLGIT